MKKFSRFVLLAAFLLVIYGLLLLFLLQDRGRVSYFENRTLASFPQLSAATVKSGEFMEGISAYVTDHFPFRDFWIKTYLKLQMLLKQTFVYDYFITEDGWVFPQPITYFPRASMDAAIASMAKLQAFAAENNIELYFVSLPARNTVLPIPYPDYLQDWAQEKRNKEYLLAGLAQEGIKIIDIGAIWLAENKPRDLFQYYWRTDHHWNMDGAFYGYQILRRELAAKYHMGTPPNPGHYRYLQVTEPKFLGSYNKQLYGLVKDPDLICYYENTNLPAANFIYYLGDEKTGRRVDSTEIYAKGLGEAQADYGLAYAPDLREITVMNEALKAEQTRTLIVKDSYVNILLPLLAEMSYLTTYYDVRHNQDRPLKALLAERQYDRIFVMYNDGNIFSAMYNFGF